MWWCSQLFFFSIQGYTNCWRPNNPGEVFHFPQGPCPPGKASPHLVLCLPFSLTNVVSNNPFRFLAESGEVCQLSRKTDLSVNTQIYTAKKETKISYVVFQKTCITILEAEMKYPKEEWQSDRKDCTNYNQKLLRYLRRSTSKPAEKFPAKKTETQIPSSSMLYRVST